MDKLWMSLEVCAKRRKADAVYSFELAYPDLELLPPFEAGAHLEVRVGQGLIRHYSLCNSPDERDRYVIGVHKASSSRGGSVAMAALNVGDVIEVSAPRNQFQLDPQARHCVLIAGGIGVTPILAMARQLHLQGRSFELHYLARSRRTAGFVQDIERSRFAHHASFHFEDELAGRPDLQRIVGQPRDGSHLYVCGPAALMDAAFDVALAQGWSASAPRALQGRPAARGCHAGRAVAQGGDAQHGRDLRGSRRYQRARRARRRRRVRAFVVP